MARQESSLISGLWERIEDEILKQDKSKAEIARECGFSRTRLYDQSCNPSLPHFIKLCEVLDVSADYLLFDKMA